MKTATSLVGSAGCIVVGWTLINASAAARSAQPLVQPFPDSAPPAHLTLSAALGVAELDFYGPNVLRMTHGGLTTHPAIFQLTEGRSGEPVQALVMRGGRHAPALRRTGVLPWADYQALRHDVLSEVASVAITVRSADIVCLDYPDLLEIRDGPDPQLTLSVNDCGRPDVSAAMRRLQTAVERATGS